MTTMQCPAWLARMPKTDLHCHLGGSLRPATIMELADQHGVDLGVRDEDGLKERIVYKNRPEKSLAAYLDGIAICESVLVAPDAFSRTAYEVCEDAHAENVRVLELRFGPTNYGRPDLKLYEIVEATLDGLRRAAEDFGMHTGLIVCGIRTDPAATRQAAEIAVNYQGHGVVGFDLAGKESGHRPRQFTEIIEPVLQNFLPVTIHAGEDDTVASIAEAIIYLNARRIGHGVTIRESTKLFDYVNKTRIGIEVCPSSNVDTGAVHAMQTHPARVFHRGDLRISVNTDNRTISDTTVTREYQGLIEHLGFSREDVYKVATRGLKTAFLDSFTTGELLDDFNDFARAEMDLQGR
jgi:adenosine deaminase